MAANPKGDELHGIYMTEEAFERLISVESPYRYELIDGVVYDMTGSTPEHSVIASNVEILVREQLGRSGPCRTHRDQYGAIPGKPPVVPDVVLTCDRADWDKDKVSQDEQHIEVYRRSMGWKQERFSAGQTVKLEQLDLDLPVESIYEGVL